MLSRVGNERTYAFLFPGVGMQYNKLLFQVQGLDVDGLRAACEETRLAAGTDVWDFIHDRHAEGSDRELMEQISIYTVNCHVFREYTKRNIRPGALLGYSLGIYSALHCSGAVSYRDGIDLVVTAYRLMSQFAGTNERWGMAVIVGLDRVQVQDIIDGLCLQEGASIINENNPYSIVISGLERSIETACAKAEEEGAFSVKRLPVSMPYHTAFMSEPAARFRAHLETIAFRDPGTPLISTITQEVVSSAAGLKQEVASNLKTGMSWARTIRKAAQVGYGNFLEVGLCDSLCRISAFIDPAFRFHRCTDVFGRGEK